MIALQDPVFPGLAAALDVEGMCDRLRQALPECRDGLNLEKAKIYDVQYQPGKSCVILYSVKFRDVETLTSEKQLLSAVLSPGGVSPSSVPNELVARYRASGDRPLRDPVIHLPQLGLVAYAFPLDPRMPSLVDAFDPAAMKLKLGRMWKKRSVHLKRVAAETLSYTPGARVAMLYETLGECRVSRLPETRHLVGKIDAQRDAADLFARHWAVWTEAAQRVQLAPPVGFVPDLNLFLQERIEGVRLSDLAGTGNFISPVRQSAKAAAALHAMELPLGFRRPFAQKAKAIRRWGSMLAAIRPQDRRRIHDLRDRLAQELERRATITGPVHGDLHPSNVLVKDNRITVIDLDNMTLGDRLLDVGRFLSALRTSALRVSGSVTGLAEAGESFLERYLSITGEDEGRARLFEAASLLITAGTGFRLQREGWEETAGALVDEAERVLRLATPPSSAGPRQAAAADPAAAERRRVVNTAWAGDVQYMRAVLDPHVRRMYEAEIGECTIERRRETEKRERLRYRLTGWRGDEPWKISLEGILWHHRSGRRVTRRLSAVHEALDANRAALLIPRPVAYFGEIGLQVLDVPRGDPLSTVLTGGEAEGAVERLARALAALHATPVALDRSRELEEELDSLRSRVQRSSASAKVGGPHSRLMQQVDDAIGRGSGKVGPVVRHLSLRRLLLSGDRIALANVEDVVLSHPFLDAADVLGRLTLTGIENGHADVLAGLAGRFRAAYLADADDEPGGLAAFEAAALLRLACSEGQRRPAVAQRLLRAVEARLKQVDAERAP